MLQNEGMHETLGPYSLADHPVTKYRLPLLVAIERHAHRRLRGSVTQFHKSRYGSVGFSQLH